MCCHQGHLSWRCGVWKTQIIKRNHPIALWGCLNSAVLVPILIDFVDYFSVHCLNRSDMLNCSSTFLKDNPWDCCDYSKIAVKETYKAKRVFFSFLHKEIAHITTCGRICLKCHCPWWQKQAQHENQVCKKIILKAVSLFKGEQLIKRYCLCVIAASSSNKRNPFYFCNIYNQALVMEHRMRPPVGSEMEIWEDTDAMRRYIWLLFEIDRSLQAA